MLRFSIIILLLVTKIVSRIEEIEINSFEWRDENGKNKPIIKIVFNGETIELPLRKAPFCHLSETEECDCYILKKNSNHSDWSVASLVKCGDKVRGGFMRSGDYFELALKKGGKPGEHIIRKYKAEGNSTGPPLEPSKEDQKKEPKHDYSSSKYIRLLPEYGQLFENETGYITTKFIVTDSLFEFVAKSDVDAYLQNYVNQANEYISKLNVLIVYQGWMEALESENKIDKDVIVSFVLERYLLYDDENTYDALFLISPVEGTKAHDELPYQCFGSAGHFVKYYRDKSGNNRRIELNILLQSLGLSLGIPKTSLKECGPIPDGAIWIMEGTGEQSMDGTLTWANCSIEKFRLMKKRLACLRKRVNISRSFCGNGLVEDGEECDCVADGCKKCCNEDCKLTRNSVCADGPCCDVSNCQVFNDKTQCRPSEDFCDIPELCDGKSAQCPTNYAVAHGYPCKGSTGESGYCYNGMCGVRGDICELTFRNASNASDACYDLNEKGGSEWGGCGPTFKSQKGGGVVEYFACASVDKFCGKIFCKQPGMEESNEMKYTEISDYFFLFGVLYSKIEDKTCGYIGLERKYRNLREDPTFVPNGSSCGNGKMCLKQKCIPLPEGCPDNCPGKKIKHPYTGEIFPVDVLGEEIIDGSPFWSILFYVILSTVLVIFLILALYIMANKTKKLTPDEITEVPPAVSRTLSAESQASKSSPITSKQSQIQKSRYESSTIGRPKESSRYEIQASKSSPVSEQSQIQKSRYESSTLGRPKESSVSYSKTQPSAIFRSISRAA